MFVRIGYRSVEGRARLLAHMVVPAFLCLVVVGGCVSTIELRIENVSKHEFVDISVSGVSYGNLAPGERSDYQHVRTRSRYAVVRFTAAGHEVNAQTLNLCAEGARGTRRFTHRIDVRDLAAGHLAVEVLRD